MPGGEEKGPSKGLRSKRKDIDTEDAGRDEEAMTQPEVVSLASIRNAINDTMSKAMSELESKISRQLQDFQRHFQGYVKQQLGEIRAEFRQVIEETVEKMEATSQRLDEAEQRIDEVETLGMETEKLLTHMYKTQEELKSKVSELEGHSRRNNIRIYGVKEGAEGSSMSTFVENLLKNELTENMGLTELGIERAHRALGPRPDENATPRSIIVRFLKYSIKEKIISAAWRKIITVDGRRIYFDHDFATEVMNKRREYLPIKRFLKENGIRFHTPMSKMRVFLDSGTVTYESADQAAKDLRAKGLPIPPIPAGKRGGVVLPNFPWERAKEKRREDGGQHRKRARDKLRESD